MVNVSYYQFVIAGSWFFLIRRSPMTQQQVEGTWPHRALSSCAGLPCHFWESFWRKAVGSAGWLQGL